MTTIDPTEYDPRVELAEERRKFQAETMTSAFLMGRIRESIETFDRSALCCDRCGWRGARMVFVGEGDHRELVCGHPQCEPPVAAPPRFGGGTLRLPTDGGES